MPEQWVLDGEPTRDKAQTGNFERFYLGCIKASFHRVLPILGFEA